MYVRFGGLDTEGIDTGDGSDKLQISWSFDEDTSGAD